MDRGASVTNLIDDFDIAPILIRIPKTNTGHWCVENLAENIHVAFAPGGIPAFNRRNALIQPVPASKPEDEVLGVDISDLCKFECIFIDWFR